MKLLFIINPISGGKQKSTWEEEIRTYFKASPHSMEFYLLDGQSDEASVRHYVAQISPDRVVGVGGDGTIKLIAEALMHKNIPLGIIPAGSANGMAKELGIPQDVEAAVEVAVNGRCRTIDAVEVNGEPCIHLSDIGLNAMLVKSFEQSKSRGMWGYARAVFKVLRRKQLMKMHIVTDAGTVQRKAYMVVIANASKYGTGATINPDGDVSDGRFEAVVVRRLNLWELSKTLLRNKTFDPEKIEVFSTTQLTIAVKHRAYFQVDGEYRGRVRELQAKVLPGCLQVMVPQ